MDDMPIMDDDFLIDGDNVVKEEEEFNSKISRDEENVESASRILKNPLLQRPVIQCILKYMNLEEVKTCRLICQEWNSAAQLLLRSLSKIKLLSTEMDPFTDERRFYPSKYLEDFSATLDTKPFTAFKISTFAKSQCHIANCNMFFEKYQKNIRELEIVKVCDEYSENKDFDITSWLLSSPIAKSNENFHTKLVIDAAYCFQVILHSSVLAKVKELSLKGDGCGVVLENSITLHPIKLKFSNVTFLTKKETGEGYIGANDLCVNDIVDLSRAKYIDLLNHYGTELSLDLSKNSNLNLDYLRLHNITLNNWNTCNWKVQKLELDDVPFETTTGMQIQELKYLQGLVDLCALPESLKKLTLDFTKHRYLEFDDEFSNLIISCSLGQPVVLKNLSYLKLESLEREPFTTFVTYAKCPNLVDIHLKVDISDMCEINSDWFPKSIKRLKLSAVKVNWVERAEYFNIDKLVLADYPFFVLEEMCTHVKAKEIVLPFPEYPTSKSSSPLYNQEYMPQYLDNCLYEFCHCLGLMSLSIFYDNEQCVYAGPFKWKDWGTFEKSPMVFLVDKESKYYVFENQAWKALDISDVEFERKCTLQ